MEAIMNTKVSATTKKTSIAITKQDTYFTVSKELSNMVLTAVLRTPLLKATVNLFQTDQQSAFHFLKRQLFV